MKAESEKYAKEMKEKIATWEEVDEILKVHPSLEQWLAELLKHRERMLDIKRSSDRQTAVSARNEFLDNVQNRCDAANAFRGEYE